MTVTIKRAAFAALVFAFSAAGAWAQEEIEYPSEWGDNVAAESNGGYIYEFSSESDPDVASHLLDGYADEGYHWEPLWSDGRPYYVTIGLADEFSVGSIVITSYPEDSSGGRPAKVTVYAGNDPDELDELGTFELADEATQVIKLPSSVKASYVELQILEDYGESGGEIGEIAVFGKSGPVGYSGTEDSDVIYLRDGSVLSGTAAMQSVDAQAFGAKVSIPAADIQSLVLGIEEGRLDRIVLKNGDSLPCVITAVKIGFKLKAGVDVSLARERVVAIGYRLKDAEGRKPGSVTVELRSGDSLTGRLVNEKVTILTSYGQLAIPAKDIAVISRSDSNPGMVEVELASGDSIIGSLAEESLRVDLDLGPVVATHPETVVSLYVND